MFCLTLLFACMNPKTIDTSNQSNDIKNGLILATVAMDYSIGALATFDFETNAMTENISSISGDPALIMDDGWLWQLNRYQYDTLRKYDPSNLIVPTAEVSLASDVGSSNPHDIAVCGERIYVSLYGTNYISILHLDTLEEIGSIDLSEFADDDGIPEASSMVVVNHELYIGLQRLDRNNGFSAKTSMTLHIECSSQTIVQQWEMGNNIELIAWNDTVAMVTQKTEVEDAGIFMLHNSEWNRVWTTNAVISKSTYQDDVLFYSSLSENQNEYTLHCVHMIDGTHKNSEPWSEYVTDIFIQDSTTAWVAAHWGWSNFENSQPGLYRMNLETCMIDEYWSMELAPFSMVSMVSLH